MYAISIRIHVYIDIIGQFWNSSSWIFKKKNFTVTYMIAELNCKENNTSTELSYL